MGKFRLVDTTLDLVDFDNAFVPNFTSKCVAAAMQSYCSDKSVLDLGSGVGVLAIFAAKKGARRVLACEISAIACDAALLNIRLNQVEKQVTICQSDLYPNDLNEKFDLIVCDVSGVADCIGEISGWFPLGTPAGGYRGSEAIVSAIKNSRAFLNERGVFIFPVLSLSDTAETMQAAKAAFGDSLTRFSSENIPFSPALYDHPDVIESLRDQGIVSFTEHAGRRFWALNIWIASPPILQP